VWAVLLDEGVYLGLISTFTGCWPGRGEPRTVPAGHPPGQREAGAGRDRAQRCEPAKWTYYYLYATLDIFSRYVAGWMIAGTNPQRWPRC
jgi:transposase InsO family protein